MLFRSDFLILKTFATEEKLLTNDKSRLHADLDLLVKPKDFPRLAKAMLSLGCQYFDLYNDVWLDDYPWLASSWRQPHKEEQFSQNGELVEIHSSFLEEHRVFYQPYFSRQITKITAELSSLTQTAKLGEQKIKTLRPTPLIVAHFLHALFQHNLRSIYQLYLFAQLLKKHQQEIDWSWSEKFLRRHHLENYWLSYLIVIDDLLPLDGLLSKKLSRQLNQHHRTLGFTQKLTVKFIKTRIIQTHRPPSKKISILQRELLWSGLIGKLPKLLLRKLLRLA